MALSGLQIQKLLPKTNCKECGSNTCLAFAMKLAAKKAELSECPYASEEAKQVLGAAGEPPVKGVILGLGTEREVRLGEETVLYRHDKTFVNQTAVAINIDEDMPGMDEVLNKIKNYELERVGQTIRIDALCCSQKNDDSGSYAELCGKAYEKTGIPVIIRASSVEGALKAASVLKGKGGVITGVTEDNWEAMAKAAEENGLAIAVTGSSLDEISALTQKIKETGFNNLIIDFAAKSIAQGFQLNSVARRAALRSNYKPLGYPFLHFVSKGSLTEETIEAVNQINKYGGITVLPSFNPAQLATLMTLRLNIYTDPQKPIQVEPKVYPVGEPDRNSPVFVTTNFSLTYFIVSGEIENSGVSAWLVIPECEGFSVLTAWAAGKFSGASIGKFIKECGLEDMVDNHTVIIPGYVSQISGELEEALPGWKVLVGPQDASDIESFVKTVLKP